ncbi:NAD-dependent epimerase/dehydratase family protein [Nocardioides stalactiti]|uniref:NAD-dependent epimerase/dehydratase family protein n=1 Tax=Nocardioides stalactiti TaxID=2755356 RepID=UPI0016044390|nr:NAD-dependent epimerase/dehydratase family protein [Nocardioides stalactiti]
MTVLIAGCGDLGTEVGLRLAAGGHRVVGWRRTPSVLPGSIEGVAADLSSAALPTVPADTDVVVIAVAADGRDQAAYRAAYVDGVGRVLDALERDGAVPRRAIFVSSTAVYGEATGPVDETSPTEPSRFNGRLMLEAEQVLLQRLAATATEPVVLRLGGIYGPGRTRLIDQVRSGEAVAPATPRRTNRIHRDDAAAAIVHLAGLPVTPDPVYLGVDDDPAELADVLRFLARELDRPEPPVAASDAPRERGADRTCSNARLRSTGFTFTYPTYVEGYRAVLAGTGVRHP